MKALPIIRLGSSTAARWIDLLPGLRLLVDPVGTSVMMAAIRDPEAQALAMGGDDADRALVMARMVARRVIRDWEGVGDAVGKPVKVTPEGIDALLDIWPVFEAFQREVLGPRLVLDAEKNASAPLPNGSSAGAKPIARPAKGRAPTARKR